MNQTKDDQFIREITDLYRKVREQQQSFDEPIGWCFVPYQGETHQNPYIKKWLHKKFRRIMRSSFMTGTKIRGVIRK